MTTRNSDRPRTRHRRAWWFILTLLLSWLLCGVASWVTAQDGVHAAGESGPGPVKSGRTPPAYIGSIMALLATFHEAGVLPPESSREADRLIHALIQSQSLFLNNRNPVVRDVFVSALSEKFGVKKAASLSQAFTVTGWTSEMLEALVDYTVPRPMVDELRLAEAFRDYNLSITDWTFVGQVFAKAKDTLLKQGKQVHAVFAAQRASMPGARQGVP